jgi:hypothetical protein
MGLNLKERSSGKHQGKLKITRRGPGIVRKWLYFAAMRTVKLPEVKPWYEAKKAKDGDRGKGALVGVMRRLAPALYAIGAHGERYEPWRLFPGRSQARQSLQNKQREPICDYCIDPIKYHSGNRNSQMRFLGMNRAEKTNLRAAN